MKYILVLPTEVRYQKSEPLTYSVDFETVVGMAVLAPYANRKVIGIVTEVDVPKPEFNTKPVEAISESIIIPKNTFQLLNWMHEYYPGGGSVTQLFAPSGIEKPHRAKGSTPVLFKDFSELPKLTKEQANALNVIVNTKDSVLLYGETGSGKSRVYLELAKEVIQHGKSVMLLVPEISLVPQIESFFKTYFGEIVTSYHSGLTKAKRSKNWQEILNSKEPKIIIGARSALFTPISNLGLIVVDEMHEPAYKQDSAPRYYALRVAGKLAKLHGAKIVYGSATPPVSEYFYASQVKAPVVRMLESALPSEPVKSTVVDMKESSNLSSYPNLSKVLVDSIKHTLDKGDQTLLFLNRRGTARQILCQSCGWQSLCPNCDTALVYHGDTHHCRCHTCGFKTNPPYKCVQCGKSEITYRSIGTKSLTDTLTNAFPEAIIRRFDTDNLTADKLDQHFEDIKAGKIDILVGTQMLGKGLDLPKLSLVGIINADTGLGMPDFSSAERSYQLLHQAIGRVGRGHTNGEVVIQTYNPKSPIIDTAIKKNWLAFYAQEITEREAFLFPPYCFLLKLTIARKTASAAETYASKLFKHIADLKLPVQALPASPSFYEKSFGRYNWQIVVKSKNRSTLASLISALPDGDWTYDLDPINLL